MNTPAISVIIATYNRAELLKRAINSVFKQTFTDFELIVVDDGSTDNTQEVLKEWAGRIKVVHQENMGCPAARNAGIIASSAELIAFLDSDDYWLEDKLQHQMRLMADPRVVLSATNWVFEDADPSPAFAEEEHSQIEYLEAPLDFLCQPTGHRILPSTIIVRRSIFNRIGLQDVRLRSAGEDTRFLFRSALEGHFAIEPSVCVVRRAAIDAAKDTRKGNLEYDRRSMLAGLEILSEAYFRAMTKPRKTRRLILRLLSGFLLSSAKQAALSRDYRLARAHFFLAMLAGIPGKKFVIAITGLIAPGVIRKSQLKYYKSSESTAIGTSPATI